MKKADFIFIAAVILMAAVIFFIYNFYVIPSENGKKVIISLNNEKYAEYSLYTDAEYVIKSEAGFNKVVISNGYCFVTEADCDNKVCINTGKINDSGDVICCLPHNLLIYIE